uniref:Metalloendopeptidase n=1 Tax=Heterorhabditis bacteriophora TaxID=37862 RepID=A0A1I7XFZ0_HETBA
MLGLCALLAVVQNVNSHGVFQIPNEADRHIKIRFDDYSEHYLLPEDFANAAIKPGSFSIYKMCLMHLFLQFVLIAVVKPTEIQMDAIQNSLLFEGDIVGIPIDEVPKSGQRMRDQPLEDDEIFRRPYHSALNLMTYPDKLWTDGEVPYMLEEGMTSDQRTAIAQAFDEYKEKTCIRFIPRTEDDFDYIYIKRNVAFGCSSYVGRAGGNQTVSLEIDKCFSKGIIAHELMHALGFFHEHSRTDRDQYVDIKEDNIRPAIHKETSLSGMLRNFEKYPRKIIDPLEMPYDYESVMHYHRLAFSRNGKPTIVPKEKDAEVGQRYKLSDIDAKKYKIKDWVILHRTSKNNSPVEVNKLYQCDEAVKITTTTTTTTKAPLTTKKITKQLIYDEKYYLFIYKCTIFVTEPCPTVFHLLNKHNEVFLPECEDLNAHCSMWKQLGHCQHSRKYMGHYCKKACGMCDFDGDSGMKGNGKEGLKEKVKETKKCKDKNLFCGYWAKIGECKSESKFMKIFCKASCDNCD